MNKPLRTADNFIKTVLLGCTYKCQQYTVCFLIQWELNDSISIICCNFSKAFITMPALCLMLSVTCYAQNYAGIIGWSLPTDLCEITCGIPHTFS